MKISKLFFAFSFVFISFAANAQVGIGTTNPNASAQLDVSSTTKGFLPPRMIASQRAAISSPVAGLMVYQTDGIKGLYYYDGTSWIFIITQNSLDLKAPLASTRNSISLIENSFLMDANN